MNGNKENASLRKRTGRQERTILILDYDGTLHDSMGIYEPAFRTAVSELEERGWLEHREYSADDNSDPAGGDHRDNGSILSDHQSQGGLSDGGRRTCGPRGRPVG